MKVAFGIGVFIAVVAVAYTYIHPVNKNTASDAQTAPITYTVPSLTGTIRKVDPVKLEVTIATPSAPMSTTTVDKIVKINPLTKIILLLATKDANGVVNTDKWVAANVSDLTKGETARVHYVIEKDNVLSGVVSVAGVLAVSGDVNAFIKKWTQALNPDPSSYIKGMVSKIDLAGKKLEYNAFINNKISTTTESVTFSNNIPVYRIDDSRRFAIIHARVLVNISDIRKSDTIFIMLDRQAKQTDQLIPQSFIVAHI